MVEKRHMVPAIEHKSPTTKNAFQDVPELFSAFVLGFLFFCHGWASKRKAPQEFHPAGLSQIVDKMG